MESRRMEVEYDPLVQIIGPDDDWILEKLARKLASKLPYARFVPWRPFKLDSTRIAYYINYALYNQPSEYLDVGFFTHEDASHNFLERAREVDHCISMSQKYAIWLKEKGVTNVTHIPMGYDSLKYRPKLVVGVVGKLEHPRKGRDIVDQIRTLEFVEIRTTEGKIDNDDLGSFYQQLDFVLIPARIEGGPLSLLEGLAMGKPIIAPENVGMVSELTPSPFIRTFPVGDVGSLANVLRQCYNEKLESRKLVNNRTWDDWAASHHQVFMELLQSSNTQIPEPGPHFRFGMIQELVLRSDIDLEPLDATIDQVSRHLFYSNTTAAISELEQALPRYPCVQPLLSSFSQPSVSRTKLTPAKQRELSETSKGAGQPSHGMQFEQAQRILLIAHVETLRDRMDKSHFYRYEALARKKGVTLFGPGIEGYQPGMSLDDAIVVACAGNAPDLVIHGGDLKDSNVPLVTGLSKSKIMKAVELLDTWAFPDRTTRFIESQEFSIGLIQEAGPHIEFYRKRLPQVQFFWTPNAVNTTIFKDYGFSKNYDIVIYGVQEDTIYPFRGRLTKLLTQASDLRVRHIQHPGYYPEKDGTVHPVISGEELSRTINQAWIGIATRSCYNCFLMKYLEIAASHAAIAGNIPDSGRSVLQDCSIELNETQSDDEILTTIRTHLSDKAQLKKLIATASKRVQREFSVNAYSDLMLGIARQVVGTN